ncbi:MAG: hypothetical protein M1822_003454 [Bathelium mastoideum]|nr:MAG: hypothetical protein M1822_003454 [Bathelium mastoideum]
MVVLEVPFAVRRANILVAPHRQAQLWNEGSIHNLPQIPAASIPTSPLVTSSVTELHAQCETPDTRPLHRSGDGASTPVHTTFAVWSSQPKTRERELSRSYLSPVRDTTRLTEGLDPIPDLCF